MNTLTWLSRLVAFDTTSRNSNLDLIHFIQDWLKEQGISSHLIFDPKEPKANLFATIPAENGSLHGGIILSGHTDVVPVDGQDWQSNPFELKDDGDKVTGRGTCDMKGFIAVVLSLVPELREKKLQKPIHLAFSYDEEIGCRGAPFMIEALPTLGIHPAACIVGEPTEMKPVIAHKGIQVFRCTVNGCAAHSSLTTQGCNAIEYAAEIICYLRKMADTFKATGFKDNHFDVPFTTVTTNLIRGGNAYNTIPAFCEFVFEFRHLPEDAPNAIHAEINQFVQEKIVPKMQSESSLASIQLDRIAAAPSFNAVSDADFTRFIQGAEEVRKVAYATEAGLFQQANIPTIICGPGSIEQAHRANEYVEKDQLRECEIFLRQVIQNFCG